MIQLNSFLQLQQINKYLRKQRESQKFLNYIEISATFSLIAIFLFFAIKPTATAIFSLIGDIKAKEALSQQLKGKINSVIKAQDVFSQAQGRYDVIESCLPDRPKFYQAAVNFSGASQKVNTSLGRVSYNINNNNEGKLAPNIDSYDVAVGTKGTYSSVLSYIDMLLNGRRLVQLKDIQVGKGGEKESVSSNEVDMSLSTKLFFLEDKNEKN
jgi:hypothetical protein